MKRFAKHVLSIANEKEIKITNLQLQKIMYFAIGQYIAEHGVDENVNKAYKTPFEAWLYGPVNPKVYREYKKYGRMTIDEKGEYDSKYKKFDHYIEKNIKRDAFEMVEDSHKRKTWSRLKPDIINGIKKINYTLEDLSNDFR